ncbi:MAG: hypothetical protein ACI4ED_02860 [Suilimivivens sp.]
MKWWESVNDKAHDFARWVKGWGSKDAQKVDDEGIGWNTNYAYGGELEEENPAYEEMPEQEPEPEQEGVFSQNKLRSMDRKVLDRSVVENAKDYEKVKHSPSVKRLIERIEYYHYSMAGTKIPSYEEGKPAQKFMNEMAEVNGEVINRMQDMQAYLIRKCEGYAQKSKRYRGVMAVCAQEATKIRTQLDYILKIQENCFYQLRTKGEVPYSGQSYEQVLMADDLNIFQEKDKTERTYLGGGMMNTLYTMEDTTRDNQTRVLKEGKGVFNFKSTGGHSAQTVTERLRQQKVSGNTYTMNTAYRDVAVSVIDKLFNLNAAVDTTFARSKSGRQSSMMDLAQGETTNKIYTYSDEKSEKQANLLKQIAVNQEYFEKGKNPEYKNEEERKKAEEAARKASNRKVINMRSKEFIESTVNLAALDIIIGHVDRHAENMMASEQGVKAIDNDTAFGLLQVSELGANHEEVSYADIQSKFQTADGNDKINIAHQALLFLDTAFPQVTEEFRQKILNVSLSAVRGALQGLINEDEIEACVNRVEALQKYLMKLTRENGGIIDSFEQMEKGYEDYHKIGKDNQNFNIMSQIKNVSGGSQFDGSIKRLFYDIITFDGPGGTRYGVNEMNILAKYVARCTGKQLLFWEYSKNQETDEEFGGTMKIKGLDLNYYIVFYLMQLLTEKAEAGNFDLKKAIDNGELDEMREKATELAKSRKEQNDQKGELF